MPNWQGSTRRARLPPNWYTEIRPRILNRDGQACTWIRGDTDRRCNLPASDVDHIIPGDDHQDSNLRSLCSWHHQQKSSSEGGRASAAARQRRAGPTGRPHPGLR